MTKLFDRFVLWAYPGALKRAGTWHTQRQLRLWRQQQEKQGEHNLLLQNHNFMARWWENEPGARAKLAELEKAFTS